MRILSTLMLVLSILFIIVKILSSLAMAYMPGSDNIAIYALHYGQIAMSVILHVFIAVVLILVKEHPFRAISYFIYVAMGIFTTLVANIIVTYFQDQMIAIWSGISIASSLILINLVIQAHLIKNSFLKPAYVIHAWSMVASTVVYFTYPYVAYNFLHQQEPSRVPDFFNAFTELALVYLILRIGRYFKFEDQQKKVQNFF